MAAPRNDNVKEKILDAATGLLDTQTFADISLAEIAAAAGVSKGTLYYYYKNKTDILFDLTNRYLDRQWDELIAWTENKDKDTSVHRLVKYVVERNTASAGMRLHLIHAAMLGDEALRAKLIDRYAAFERLIAEKIAERTDAVSADYLSQLILLRARRICAPCAPPAGSERQFSTNVSKITLLSGFVKELACLRLTPHGTRDILKRTRW